MSAELLSDGTVRVPDPSEAGAVYGRGFFGEPKEGGLLLERAEAAYLVEMDRLEVRGRTGRSVPFPELFRLGLRKERDFGVRYLVYRDLRQRGYVARPGPPPVDFSVLPRGGVLHKTPSRFWVDALSERGSFDLAGVRELHRGAQAAKKTLLLGVVDEESDLTYYHVRSPSPRGSLPPLAPAPAADAWLTDDRVLLFESAAVETLGGRHAFGSRIGARLELSLIEAAFLLGEGRIAIRSGRSGRPVPPERFLQRAERIEPGFFVRLPVYRALRERHLVVKTGFKYGAHFRAYPRDPGQAHARYLVEAVPEGYRAPWPDVAGAVRLAQGVRKEFLFGFGSEPASVRFLSLDRVRP